MKNLHSSAKSHHQNHATLSVVLYVIAAFIAVFAVYTTFAAGSNLIAYASIQGQDVSFLTDIIPAVFQQSFPMYAYALIFLTFGKTYDKVFAVYNTIFPRKSSDAKEAVKPEESKPEDSESEEVKAEAQEEIVQDFVERCTEEESGEVAVEEEISVEEPETTKEEASTEESEKNEESKEEESENKTEEELEESKKAAAEESDSNKEDSSNKTSLHSRDFSHELSGDGNNK